MFTIISVAIVLGFLTQTESKTALRVISGRDASPDEYPYVLSLQRKQTLKFSNTSERQIVFTRFCTGSLITPTWVLTAAHCLKNGKLSSTFVRYGDMTIHFTKAMQFYIQVLKQILHPDYKMIRYSFGLATPNDIALMQTESAVPVPVGRLSAIDYPTLLGSPVTFAGFGFTKFNFANVIADLLSSENAMKPLQVGEGGIIPCSEDLVNKGLCVAAKCNNLRQHVFHGDSGGPLFYKNHIVGVHAFVLKDLLNQRIIYSFHTPVSHHLEWINIVIR